MPSKDSWTQNYDSLVELGANIGIKIRERDENKSDPKLNPQLSKMLHEYQKKLKSLTNLYQRHARDHSIPFEEVSIREGMIEDLNKKYNHLQKCYNRGWSTEAKYSSTGIKPGAVGGARGGAVGMDWERGMGTAEDIRMQQRDMIEEQDEGLGQLSKALRNQQKMGLAMQDEIQEQNVLIDDIQEHTTQTDQRVRTQAVRARHVRQKYSYKCSCGLWTIVVLLAITIVVVGAVPF